MDHLEGFRNDVFRALWRDVGPRNKEYTDLYKPADNRPDIQSYSKMNYPNVDKPWRSLFAR